MKKVALIFTLTLLFSFNVYAEIYHGIDIDKVYDQSDWSSKDKIKELIDDYSLLLTYQEEFNACPKQYNKIFSCYDKITEKILRNLYVYPNNTIKTYQEFRKILLKA